MSYKILRYLNPYWWIHPYFINFIEEFWGGNTNYITGRMEIWTQWSEYDIDEVRFYTKDIEGLDKFREKWDYKDVSWFTLRRIKKELKEKFNKKLN